MAEHPEYREHIAAERKKLQEASDKLLALLRKYHPDHDPRADIGQRSKAVLPSTA